MQGLSTEELRRKYKPKRTRVLFIGESAPAGGTFFYRGDSNLARHTKEAFAVAFNRSFEDDNEFLDFFKSTGCYLDDLCLVPVNKEAPVERSRCWEKGIEPLSRRMRKAKPKAVVVVMKGIRRHVERAAIRAGIDPAALHTLPFPTRGRQKCYVESLVGLLRGFEREGIWTE